jgi:putative phosphonate catabolism associated alcohol dehydrogenase
MNPSNVRAAIFDGPGAPLHVELVMRPGLQPGEALVRVSLCTVCGSDLHTFTGRRKEKTPCVLGHEPVGVVEEVNGELRDVRGEPVVAGDRVVWAVAVSCGTCFFCRHGLPQKCESLRKYGHEAMTPQCGPVGGLATHCHLLKGTAIVKVPLELPEAVAAPAGCATATVAAVLRACGFGERPGSSQPSTVVVFGMGMLGLTACAWLDVLGATAVACDVSDTRLSHAARFGARHLAKPDALADLVKSLTAGRGADAALELSGSPTASASALEVLRVGGTAVWAGTVSPTDPVPVLPEVLVRRCLTIAGVHNYTPHDLATAIEFLATHHKRFPFAELVAKTFPLAEVNDAFQFAEAERPVRVAVACG